MNVLEHLRCPSCRAAMQPALSPPPADGDGAGILACHCAEHPVLDGIVCINDAQSGWPEGARVLEHLKRARPDLALAATLLGSHRNLARRVAGRLERAGFPMPTIVHEWLCRLLLRRLFDGALTFERAARLLRKREYALYLVHRWAIPSQHAAIPLILLLGLLRHDDAREPQRVLEIAGGAGHACALMLRRHPEHEVILTDADFGNLWLARRFVAPGAAAYVRFNAERTLPFVGSSMDAVYCCDAFHFIRDQEGLAAELDRVTRADGVWMLPHLHNVLADNLSTGRARTPEGWSACLGKRRAVRLASEARILSDFIQHERLDLAAPDPDEVLDASNALTAVAGPASLWRSFQLGACFHDGAVGLGVNPAYAIKRGSRGRLRLRRRRFRGLLRVESSAATHMPRQVEVDRRILDGLRRGSIEREHEQTVAELRRRMVITPSIGAPRLRAARAEAPLQKHTREDSNLRPAV